MGSICAWLGTASIVDPTHAPVEVVSSKTNFAQEANPQVQAKGACRREGPNERAIGSGIGVLPAQVPSGQHARRMHPPIGGKRYP